MAAKRHVLAIRWFLATTCEILPGIGSVLRSTRAAENGFWIGPRSTLSRIFHWAPYTMTLRCFGGCCLVTLYSFSNRSLAEFKNILEKKWIETNSHIYSNGVFMQITFRRNYICFSLFCMERQSGILDSFTSYCRIDGVD